MENAPLNELPGQDRPTAAANVIITTGAVIAVLLGIPSFFIGLYGAVGVITGNKLIAGSFGAIWGYLAVTGAYELNRRKFDWERGRRFSDRHLMCGTIAVSIGLVISGAMHETMPALALVPAVSAVIQANDGHKRKHRFYIHATILATGIAIATWIYSNGIMGKIWLERIETWP